MAIKRPSADELLLQQTEERLAEEANQEREQSARQEELQTKERVAKFEFGTIARRKIWLTLVRMPVYIIIVIVIMVLLLSKKEVPAVFNEFLAE